MSTNKSDDTKPLGAKDFAPPAADSDLKKTVEDLSNQVRDLQEKYENEKAEQIRLVAELRNQKDRLDRARKLDVERAARYFITDLLPCLDGLEKALEAAEQENASIEGISNGIQLTQTEIEKVLQKHHVEIIRPLGEAFNADCHEALAMADSPEAPANSVINVVQTGYKLGSMLIRPAKVIVCNEKNDTADT